MIKDKPIAFIDLETTGKEVSNARIVEIGVVKIFEDGRREEKRRLVNPGIPIPPEVSEIHGIKDEDVASAPRFIEIAKDLAVYLGDCYIAGYNSDKFDIPILVEEFARCGIIFPQEGTQFLDVIKLERLHNGHKLEDVYRRYTGEALEGAHGALTDAKATAVVLEKIIEKYHTQETTLQELIEATDDGVKRADFAGKLKYNDQGELVWNFGPHYDKPVMSDVGFYNWVMAPKADGKEFPFETRRILAAHARQLYDQEIAAQEPPTEPPVE